MAKKVLVVDDDVETRMIVSDYLARLEVDHLIVASAGECLARLVNNPAEFSMVLMDIHMPALSGVDASTWIKDSDIDPPRNIPIIALTGDEAYHDEGMVAGFGMNGVLPKPVTLESLATALKKYKP